MDLRRHTPVILVTSLLLGAFLGGCAKVDQKPLTPVPESKPPIAKTHGVIHVGNPYTLWVQYKNINTLIDPSQIPPSMPPPDYLLLTRAGPAYFGESAKEVLRKNLKVIAPANAKAQVGQWGFLNAKGLTSGVRFLLKKDGAFLFVSAIGPGLRQDDGGRRQDDGGRRQDDAPNRHSREGGNPLSYLLEFGNGRNVFISGDMKDANAMREFVYSLRDDGKEVHIAFFYSGTQQQLAEMILLLQPQSVYIFEPLDDMNALRAHLKEELFEGFVDVATPGTKIDF